MIPKILAAFYMLDPPTKPFYFFNGADQAVLFGPRYQIVEWGLIAFAVIGIAADLLLRRIERRRGSFDTPYAIPVQFCALAILAVWLLPGGVQVSSQTTAASLLTERFTTISAVLACCLLGAMRPRKWHLAATGVVATGAVHFTTAAAQVRPAPNATMPRCCPCCTRPCSTASQSAIGTAAAEVFP